MNKNAVRQELFCARCLIGTRESSTCASIPRLFSSGSSRIEAHPTCTGARKGRPWVAHNLFHEKTSDKRQPTTSLETNVFDRKQMQSNMTHNDQVLTGAGQQRRPSGRRRYPGRATLSSQRENGTRPLTEPQAVTADIPEERTTHDKHEVDPEGIRPIRMREFVRKCVSR